MAIKTRTLTLTEIVLIAGTRVALGAGIGLLISSRLNASARKAAGLALFGVGVLTTIPLAMEALSGARDEDTVAIDDRENDEDAARRSMMASARNVNR